MSTRSVRNDVDVDVLIVGAGPSGVTLYQSADGLTLLGIPESGVA
jgi:ribulose 1,5-bisphosphate synthetase/thiazole synthase